MTHSFISVIGVCLGGDLAEEALGVTAPEASELHSKWGEGACTAVDGPTHRAEQVLIAYHAEYRYLTNHYLETSEHRATA